MISDIVSLLRFITDPDTRKTIESLAHLPSRDKLDWKRDVKMASAKFNGSEPFKVASFVNAILADMRNLTVHEPEIEKFVRVFDELIRNAFEHGCQGVNGCKVSIHCTYSRWFIALKVEDTGKGFDYQRALVQDDDDIHGLQLVSKLSYKVTASNKGKAITVLLIPDSVMEILPKIEKYRGEEILTLAVNTVTDWNYLTADWEPLRRAVRIASQHLILVDCAGIRIGTQPGREMKIMVKELSQDVSRRFALIVNSEMDDMFDFSNLNSNNFKVFVVDRWNYLHTARSLPAAEEWLLDYFPIKNLTQELDEPAKEPNTFDRQEKGEEEKNGMDNETAAELPFERRCTKCGALNPLGTVYCLECGTKLPDQRRCPACQALNHEGATFCDQCGQKLTL